MVALEALIAAIVLLLFALLFMNGVEKLGELLKLTEFATGAVLAAFLTAMPEAMLAVLAPAFGTKEAQEIGMGAVLSAPSITLFLGVPLVLYFSKAKSLGELLPVRKNYLHFALILMFPVAFGTMKTNSSVLKSIFGLVLLLLFIYLGLRMFKEKGDEMEAEEELYMARVFRREESLALSFFQTLAGILGMILAANMFIQTLSETANPLIYTLMISPFATCLEETIVALVWSMKGRAYLGLSVLSGENVIQATAVFGLGILFTDWNLPLMVLPMAFLMVSVSLIYYFKLPGKRAAIAGLFAYLIYMLYLFIRI